MKNAIYYLLFALPLLTGVNVSTPQTSFQTTAIETDTLHWSTESCTYIGTFDKSKYSKKELADTYSLWFTHNSLQLHTADKVINPKKYYDFDSPAQLKLLESEYRKKKQTYAELELVSGKIWKELLKNRKKNLDEWYGLLKINIEAHGNPEVLLKNRFSKNCTEYAEVLASNDTLVLMNAWKKLMKERNADNFSESSFDRKNKNISYKSKIAFSKSYIMAYGWHNCANKQINYELPNVNYQEAFEKLFLSVETECEEP